MSAAEKFVTAEKMAEILCIDTRGIYRLIKKREIPHLQVGGTYRFNPTEVIESLKVVPSKDRTSAIRHRDKNEKRKKSTRIDWSKYE